MMKCQLCKVEEQILQTILEKKEEYGCLTNGSSDTGVKALLLGYLKQLPI